MDTAARDAVPALVDALEDESQYVVRAAADALGAVGAAEAAASLGALLHAERPGWDAVQQRGWCVRDQVRVNAATALARLGTGRRRRRGRPDRRARRPCGQ